MSFRKPFRAVPIQLGKRYRDRARRERLRKILRPAILLFGAAALGGLAGVASTGQPASSAPTTREPLSGCAVTDGDTIRCSGERIRLLGIDAPELPGHCRSGRVCAPGDPVASTRSLDDALAGNLRIERVGEDHYGRTLALVSGAKGDLSCWQLNHGQAIYRADWDNGGRVRGICPKAAR